MPLPPSRSGESVALSCFPIVSEQSTLANPEIIVWSSLRQLCTQEIAYSILFERHGLRGKSKLKDAAHNIRLYIFHAYEMYEAAERAKANTAPLLYYYSFLNLAKARCEIARPRFHETAEAYVHGISWRPNPRRMVNLANEKVSLTRRGIWHAFFEAVTGKPCAVPNPATIKLQTLFALCPEVNIEYEASFAKPKLFIALDEANFKYDRRKRQGWVQLSCRKDNVSSAPITKPRLIANLTNGMYPFHQVQNSGAKGDVVTFEQQKPLAVKSVRRYATDMHNVIRELNLFTTIDAGNIRYFLPLTYGLPIRMPQVLVLYSILFWLGSLVRYDPHSVQFLQSSAYWELINGYMNQSRLWLLELFEWEFFQTETTLRSAR